MAIKPPDIFTLTEEMLLDLMRGKYIQLHLDIHDPKKARHLVFKGPFDGMFLTYEEISHMQYNSEMGAFGIVQKLQKDNIHSYELKSKDNTCMKCGGVGGVKTGPPCSYCEGKGFVTAPNEGQDPCPSCKGTCIDD